MEKISGDPISAIQQAHRILNVKGHVIPVTAQASTLYAELQDGTVVAGEHAIDETRGVRAPIQRCFLDPAVEAHPAALRAIASADVIVIGPGDLYTSLIPVLLVRGIARALSLTRGVIVYVMNLATKYGQTDGYTASRFYRSIQTAIAPARLDVVLLNQSGFPPDLAKRYEAAGEFLVKDDLSTQEACAVSRRDLIASRDGQKVSGDVLQRSLLRHDPDKLAKAIMKLLP